MPDDISCFELPPVMLTEDCTALHAFLCDSIGYPVVISGAAVEKFCGQAAQVLVAHQKFRAGTEAPITLRDASDALLAALSTLALSAVAGVE